MANTIIHKQSSVPGKVPLTTDLVLGELAINTNDGIVYLKTGGNVVQQVGHNTTTTLTEGSNLYYTDSRVRSAISATGSLSYNGATGEFSFTERTPSELLIDIKTVDGTGSGLDADTLDGLDSLDFVKKDGSVNMSGALDMNSQKVINLGDGVNSTDAVNKGQLDAAQAGILVKQPCRVATDAALPAVTAAGSGAGKTLTANTVGVLTVDGINTVLGDRIMVKDQVNQVDNGIYDVTTEGTAGVAFVLTRSTDYDGNPLGEVAAGTYSFIDEGTNNDKTGWTLTDAGLSGGGSPVSAVVDTDTIIFAQFQGLPQYTAGNQLSLTNNQFDVVEGPGSGLDADTVDGIQAASFLRSDQNDTHAGTISPTTNNTYNLGTATERYNIVYATTFDGTSTNAQYADLAEIYAGDKAIEAGTVVCFGGEREVTECSHDMDTKIAGVVSTNPAHIMNAGADYEFTIEVALTGRVPCKVSGPVKKGDMMVSDGKGGARAEADPKMGSVIGKALEDSEGEAVIEVVVGRM